MFRGDDIRRLVEVFDRRGVLLYHACQYQDFVSYLQLGGVPSRALLEQSRASFTPFATDDRDHTNGVWGKVFVNLEDFGSSFAAGRKAVPNPYGPILLAISPKALLEAADVAICLRSAGGTAFDRERESLKTMDEVERLFFENALVKWSNGLRVEFNDPDAHAPEVSCTFEASRLGLSFVKYIRVDPYVFQRESLLAPVRRRLQGLGLEVRAYERNKGLRVPLYVALGEAVAKGHSFDEILEGAAGDELRQWAKGLSSKDLRYQFDRYARYLRAGTIDVLENEDVPEEFHDRDSAAFVDTHETALYDPDEDEDERGHAPTDVLCDEECPECGAIGSFEVRSSGVAVCTASGCSGIEIVSFCLRCDYPVIGAGGDESFCEDCESYIAAQ